MNQTALQFRYINYACYELRLPNGKVIVIDPCCDYTHKSAFTAEDFTGADYILLSHTHYDHTMDVGILEKKYNSKIFVGALSAYSLCDFFDLDFDHIYPVTPNEVFCMEDFDLHVFRGKHTFLNNPNNRMSAANHFGKTFPSGHKMCDIYGTIEYIDYLITTKENMRLYISGGGPHWLTYSTIQQTMKEMAPNVVFRQTSSKYTPETFAQTMADFQAQLILPLHQDGIIRKMDISIDEYIDRANLELQRLKRSSRVLNPIPHKWYSLSMSICEE
jgi:L-ascorbate metabolism protein UlaG (beta-lactamase superfamily)